MMKTYFACELFLISGLVISATSSIVRADLIIFDRQAGDFDGSNIDEQETGLITRKGLIARFTANIGVLNATQNDFGIKVKGSGDETNLLDSVTGAAEFITVTFDQPVRFTQLTLDEFAVNETASLKIGPNAAQTIDALAAATDVYNFTSSNLIAPGQSLVIGSGTGNGFSLEGFAVNTVPEPTTFELSALAIAGLLSRRRDRR